MRSPIPCIFGQHQWVACYRCFIIASVSTSRLKNLLRFFLTCYPKKADNKLSTDAVQHLRRSKTRPPHPCVFMVWCSGTISLYWAAWTLQMQKATSFRTSQMKHQLDATLCRFYFCRVTLHVSGTSAHHQEYLKLVQQPLVHVFCKNLSEHQQLSPNSHVIITC